MAGSEHTRHARRLLWLYRILDWVILFAPLIIYICIAFSNDGVTKIGKIGLVGSVMIALILTLVNVLAQKRLRCPIWIILLGLFVAIRDMLLPLVIILAITSVIDDLLLTPIISYYRTKLIANKAIDDRE